MFPTLGNYLVEVKFNSVLSFTGGKYLMAFIYKIYLERDNMWEYRIHCFTSLAFYIVHIYYLQLSKPLSLNLSVKGKSEKP